MSTVPAFATEPNWAAFVAIDWGSRTHSWAISTPDRAAVKTGVLDNKPEAVELWATALRREFPTGSIAVAVEQKRGSVIYMLSKYDHLVLYPVPPSMSARYRGAFRPSGAKDDPSDAVMLLDLLRRHREHLRPLAQDTAETRLLRFLVQDRRNFVQQKVRVVQQLTDSVQQYFPQVRTWFALDTPLVAALLRRWPTLPQLQRAHPGTLKRFLLDQRCRDEELIATRIQAIYTAVAATQDSVVIEECTRKTAALLTLLAVVGEQIASYDKRIAEVTANHPDAPIFASFPGAGAATVPRLIAAFGTCRDSWTSAAEMQRFSGIAPVLKRSGKTSFVVMRQACPKFVRQTFHELAGQSIPHSAWARAYYDHHLQGNKGNHHRAVRALAYRWIRVLYRCWKDRQLFDERLLLQAQRRRNSLLSGKLTASTGLQWAPQAGFQKLTDERSHG